MIIYFIYCLTFIISFCVFTHFNTVGSNATVSCHLKIFYLFLRYLFTDIRFHIFFLIKFAIFWPKNRLFLGVQKGPFFHFLWFFLMYFKLYFVVFLKKVTNFFKFLDFLVRKSPKIGNFWSKMAFFWPLKKGHFLAIFRVFSCFLTFKFIIFLKFLFSLYLFYVARCITKGSQKALKAKKTPFTPAICRRMTKNSVFWPFFGPSGQGRFWGPFRTVLKSF